MSSAQKVMNMVVFILVAFVVINVGLVLAGIAISVVAIAALALLIRHAYLRLSGKSNQFRATRRDSNTTIDVDFVEIDRSDKPKD